MRRFSTREMMLLIVVLCVGLCLGAMLTPPRLIYSKTPDYDFLATDLKLYPWSKIWHLCRELDNEDAGLKFFNIISRRYDEISDGKWPIPPIFLVRELAEKIASTESGSSDNYLIEVWCDGKTIRYAYERWRPGITKDEIVGDMNDRLQHWIDRR